MVDLTDKQLAYVAGFLDGDGCILTQIVRGRGYRYGYRVRVGIVFFQKNRNSWFLYKLKEELRMGAIRSRKDGMTELSIFGYSPTKELLLSLKPFLRLKRPLCRLVLSILEALPKVASEADFLEVCKLVDRTADYTYSKKRKITSLVVRQDIGLPVETKAE